MIDINSNVNAHGIFQESKIQKHTMLNSAGFLEVGNVTSATKHAFGVKTAILMI